MLKFNKAKASVPASASSDSILTDVVIPASLVAPRRTLSGRLVGTLAIAAALGVAASVDPHLVHAVHAAGTDTGTVDSYTLDTGAFNGVISGAGSYLNLLIKNFGVPAILVSLAISGWGFVRHIAKGAFH